MTSDDPPNDADRSPHGTLNGDPTEDRPIVIYPLVADRGNRRVLEEWLAERDRYRVADGDRSLSEAGVDLCIVDGDGLRRHKAELEAVKAEARPALFPVLLLLSEGRSEVIDADGGAIADNVFATTVDEIISMPIRQTELDWRIRSLCRQREQSLELRTRADELKRFREAVEASGHAIWITDADGTIEYVNPAFETITGYTAEEAIGEQPDLLNSGEMPAEHFERLWDSILSGEVWDEEVVNRRKDGEIYTAQQTIAPIVDADGEIDAFVAVQTDITERKELQDRLKRHRDIVQRLEDPIMLQDREGNFQLLNDAVTEFAGRSRDELFGGDESRFMDDATAEAIQQRKANVLETETPAKYSVSPEFEETGIGATFSTRRYPWYNDEDELSGTIAICRDVTELEERTRQLKVLDHILRHNLRNSLTVILGLAEDVRSRSSGETADAAEAILDRANTLLSTSEKSRAITNVLSEELDRTTIDIETAIDSVAESMRTAHPNAEIETSVPDGTTAQATTQIDDAIEELVRNAIVHHDRDAPSVELRVRVDADAVAIDVIDDGPGMDPMDRDVLETGRAISDLYHGSGLGLWLVYWIVSRSDGTIDFEDVEPRGTRVTLRLPRRADVRSSEL